MWAPQPGPQLDAIAADWCPQLFYGGAAGGGKSDFLLGDYLQDVPTYGQAWRGVIFRRTTGELEELQARAAELFPSTGADYNVQKRTWGWSNGATLKMRYLEADRDATRYQGHQYTWIGFDELTQWRTLFPYRYLRGRLRSAHLVPTKRIRAAANPGGAGHADVKAYFIDPARDGYTPILDSECGMERMFIPAKLRDNAALTRNDPGYEGRLRGLGGQLAKAMADGDWDVIEGAFFDNWGPRNICRPFEIPAEWTRFRSLDWGSAKPFSVGWWAVCGDTGDYGGQRIPRGALIRYREWYGSTGKPNEGLKMTAEAVAQGVKAREIGETMAYGVADPAIFSSDGGPSIGERMYGEGVSWRRADNARVSRAGAMGGWDQMRARISGDDDRPGLVVFSTCKDFIRTVPVQQHDIDRPEDLDTDGEDHCFVGATLVATPSGPRRLDRLPPFGEVIGPDGSAVFYHSPRITRGVARLVRVRWSSGRTVVCTPDHRFLTELGWCEAQNLSGSWCCQAPFRSSKANASTGAAATFSARAGDYIALCGRLAMALFRVAFTCTTWITTPLTTSLRTSSWSLDQITYGNIGLSARSRLPTGHAHLPRHGTQALRESAGIASTTSATFAQHSLQKPHSPVSSAGRFLTPRPTWRSRLGFATRTAGRVRCVAVVPLRERRPVWCLTVPGAEAFALANGVIAHNCADEARYACMSRPYVREVPKPPKTGTGLAGTMTFEQALARAGQRGRDRI